MLLRKHRKICQCYISIHAPANRAVTHTQNVHICFHTCTCHKCAHTHTRSAICLGVQQQHRSPTATDPFPAADLRKLCARLCICSCVFSGVGGCAGAILRAFFVCVCDHSSARSGEVCASAYISENAPVYGDVSVHMLEWAPRRITGICGCLCVRVGGCVRW